MSGFTSQPSMGAIVASLEGTDLDTGVNLDHIAGLTEFWYAGFHGIDNIIMDELEQTRSLQRHIMA